jgi:hypothetical protein
MILAMTLVFFLEHRPRSWGSPRPDNSPSPQSLWQPLFETTNAGIAEGQGVHVLVKKRLFGRYDVEFTSSPPTSPRSRPALNDP